MRKSYSNGYYTGFATNRKTRKILQRLRTKGFVVIENLDLEVRGDIVRIANNAENDITAFVDRDKLYLIDEGAKSKNGFTYGR